MRVVGLLRVSTDKQADHGTSLETQAARYEEFVRQGGHADLYTFRGAESATQAIKDRRVLQDLLRYIAEHEVDGVWVIEQSRLSRGDELETALLMRELRERGIKVIVNNSVRDPASIDEAFMLRIQSAVDNMEAMRIKERMSRGKRRRAENGQKNCGPAPYAYKNPRPGEPGRGTLQVVESEAAVVRRIYTMRSGGEGTRVIAKALNASGIPSPKGGAWGKTTVERILANQAYAGTMASGAWTAEKGSRTFRYRPGNPRAIVKAHAHVAIVPKDLWDSVQTVPKAARTSRPRLLTEMVWVNGLRYGSDVSGGVGYYRTPRGIKGRPWIESKLLDSAAWYHFTTLARSEEFVRGLMQAHGPNEREVAEREVEYTTERLGKARRRLDRLLEMRMSDEITKPEFDRKAGLEREAIAGLERELESHRAKLASMDGDHAARIVRTVQALLFGQTKLSPEQRRQIIRSIVRRVDVTAEPSGEKQKRDAKGRPIKGSFKRWRIASVAFQLTVPSDATLAAQTRHGATWGERGATGAGSENGLETRAETSESGLGQMATTSSCSGLQGLARR